ncbi:ATP-grasp ribosomal peptide maturase [Streptomyces sp. NBC_01267]|uniref:ATP-grasp ribosomal peptide maturase n=1 Tax=unclassified Streptomyces TaxID=2593676 RepID=UPI00225B5360|nr:MULTISPECIES: ATP-grasp ribosomal peptide maturase [unclassified Streptomyces]MCX4550211.1 ATP-grasp ribosomal peptide maturase [Streptomyces sp. NBC_01500]WSV55665.1 ATP-grasp ribosomal peptide maturase [Streptomyces sp. NBC_01014]
MSAILVIAARDDWPTDRVIKILGERGARVFRMDTADFPQHLGVAARIDQAATWHGELATDSRTVDLADIDAVYFRAPGGFSFPEDMSGPERRFAAAQARAGLGGVITALEGCRWVSNPAAMARAEYKPVQLAAAREAGLRIAPTLITNRPESVRAFAAEARGPIVCKPVASPVFIEGNQLKAVYSKRLDADGLTDLRGIESTAHLFQAWADKAYEVRLTVVGNRMFAAEIHAGSDAAYEDWRTDYASLTYAATDTPADVASGVRRLLDMLHLRYAALDFVVSPAGEWTFLEANPCGQWDWIAHATDLPIAEAIADELQGAAA